MTLKRILGRPSIEWLLPTAISLTLMTVLLALSWWAYADMSRSLRQAAHERLEMVATQLGQSLQTSAARAKQNVQARADSAPVRNFLLDPTPGNREAARDATTYGGDRPELAAAIEVLDASGRRVLVTGRDSNRVSGLARRLIPRTRSRETAAVGVFHAVDDSTIVMPSIALVSHEGRRLGYVVDWRIVRQSPAERDMLTRILGSGARLLLGGTTGEWTDQVAAQRPPPSEVRPDSGIVSYDRPGVGRQIALLRSIPATPWLMLIEFSEDDVLAPALRFRSRLLRAAAVLIMISFAAAWLLSRRVTTPLRELTVVSEAISAGDYSRRVHVDGNDEMRRLGNAFNTMTERIQQAHQDLERKIEELRTTREQFVRAQRMEAVGQLAGGIAHDFNNLLTVILAESEFAAGESRVDERSRSIAEIQRAGERAATLTRQLLAFSRRQLFAPTVFDITELVADMQRMLTRLVGDNVQLLMTNRADARNVLADRAQIEQVLVNLIVNARDAMPNGGTVTIEIRNIVLDEAYVRAREELQVGEYVLISVSDTGIGMTDEVLAHIFEPFFTTKEHGRGTGLGLATSYGIVKQSGGHIAAYSEPGLGTTMRVFLPVAHEDVTLVQPRHVVDTSGAETVLLVEDDDAVRHVAARILRRQGYTVLEADSGESGLELVRNHPGTIHLMLTDVVLPGMGGREIAEHAAELRPELKIMFTSGYTDDVILQHNLILRDATLVEKPFTAESLGASIRQALDT